MPLSISLARRGASLTIAAVPDHASELSLVWCLLLNAAVFGSAWWFTARRVTASRSQAILDAAVLGYVIQYLAVGLPGLGGLLRAAIVTGVAVTSCIVLLLLARRRTITLASSPGKSNQWIGCGAVAVFAAAFLFQFVDSQANLPVFSNDALTYHFPAAAQWLQHGRIDLFQTWFFNPANTYSPLAGSTFIAWLILPFGNDVLARFVEVPALLCVGLAAYRLSRQLKTGPGVASMVAAAVVLCRPLFLQSMMGKDDLFLAFNFIALLVALAPERAGEKWGPARVGVTLGLLLAIKYTALLAVPVLLLAVDGPIIARWRARQWGVVAFCATVLAGPWYSRNYWLTQNPVFPLDISVMGVRLFHGLFTPAASDAFGSLRSAVSVLVGGNYGMPVLLGYLLATLWLLSPVALGRAVYRDPLVRTCVFGPVIGFAIFFWRSPFPEVRFVVPEFILLFAVAGLAVDQTAGRRLGTGAAFGIAGVLPVAALGTIFVPRVWPVAYPLALTALTATAFAIVLFWFIRNWSAWRRSAFLGVLLTTAVLGLAYVRWTAYCRDCEASRHSDDAGYAQEYPAEEKLWKFVDQQLPTDAVVAYSNLYLIYPMNGFQLRRRFVYAPTRAGVKSMADLPWLGEQLSGEQLVNVTTRVTQMSPDRASWIDNLRSAGAGFLVLGKQGIEPPEDRFARKDPGQFKLVFDCAAGSVFEIR